MKRLALLLVMILSLSSCAGLGALLPATPTVGIDTEVTAGDKEEAYGIKNEATTTQKASVIHNIEERIGWPTMLLIVLLAGWAIPDPMTMGRGILEFMRLLLPWGRR